MNRKQTPRVAKAVAITGICILLAAMYYSACWGLSDIYDKQAKRIIETWRISKEAKQPEIESALALIIKAQKLNPLSPVLMERHAQILQWQSTTSPDEIEKTKVLKQVLVLYRRSLTQRPTWPYAWVELTKTKAQLNQFDDEFSFSLIKANQFGHEVALIQLQLSKIGFQYWSNLSSTEQDFIWEIYDNALLKGKLYPKKLIQLAIQYDQLEQFCLRTGKGEIYSSSVKYHCNRINTLR